MTSSSSQYNNFDNKAICPIREKHFFGMEDYGSNFTRNFYVRVDSEILVAYGIDVSKILENLALKNELIR